MADHKEQTNRAIDAIMAKMKELWLARDADGFAEFYTEDVRMVIPGVGIVQGKEAVIQRFRDEMGRVERWENWSIDRTIGDTVVSDLGQFRLKLKDKEEVVTGTWNITYVKQDGQWRVKYDCDVI